MINLERKQFSKALTGVVITKDVKHNLSSKSIQSSLPQEEFPLQKFG